MDQNPSIKPKYEIITDDILARIHNGDFSYDTVLCTEKQLSELYHVSRITAKRAITDLEQRGILYRKRGVGSFVSRNALSSMDTPSRPSRDSRVVAFLLPFDCTKGNLMHTIEAVTGMLNPHGYFLSLYITDNLCSKEKVNIKLLLSQNISGLVYYPVRDRINLNLLNEFVFAGIPVIVIDKSTDCPYLHNVVSNNFEGGRLMTEYLIGQGHRNIAFFTIAPIEETSSVRNRFAGYLHQMKAAGIPVASSYLTFFPHEIPDASTRTDVPDILQSTVSQLYNSGFTAIIAENDLVARLICIACRSIGLRVPEDISVCGFDDTDVARESDITSVRQDFTSIGTHVGQILLDAFSNSSKEVRKVAVPVELIVRSSTGKPRDI